MKEKIIKALGGATKSEVIALDKKVENLTRKSEDTTKTLNALLITMAAETAINLVSSVVKAGANRKMHKLEIEHAHTIADQPQDNASMEEE